MAPLDLDWRISGIPCRVRLVEFEEDAAFEYEVLDSRGRPAPWLARKVSDDEHAAIAAEFRELLENAE